MEDKNNYWIEVFYTFNTYTDDLKLWNEIILKEDPCRAPDCNFTQTETK